MKRNRKWTAVVAAASLASVLLFGACSNGSDDDETPVAPAVDPIDQQAQAISEAIKKAITVKEITGDAGAESKLKVGSENKEISLGTDGAIKDTFDGATNSAAVSKAINAIIDAVADTALKAIKEALSSATGNNTAKATAVKKAVVGSEATGQAASGTVAEALKAEITKAKDDTNNTSISNTGTSTATALGSTDLTTALTGKDFADLIRTAIDTFFSVSSLS